MIPPARKKTIAIHPATALLLAVALGGPNGAAATVDYPPPPGAYRSESPGYTNETPPPASAGTQYRTRARDADLLFGQDSGTPPANGGQPIFRPPGLQPAN